MNRRILLIFDVVYQKDGRFIYFVFGSYAGTPVPLPITKPTRVELVLSLPKDRRLRPDTPTQDRAQLTCHPERSKTQRQRSLAKSKDLSCRGQYIPARSYLRMRPRPFLFAAILTILVFSSTAHAQKPADSTKITISKSDTTKIEKTTDSTVYITKSGKKYHRAGCIYLGKSAIPIKLSDAKKYYQPCKRCKPGE
jgi:hypothetical protein